MNRGVELKKEREPEEWALQEERELDEWELKERGPEEWELKEERAPEAWGLKAKEERELDDQGTMDLEDLTVCWGRSLLPSPGSAPRLPPQGRGPDRENGEKRSAKLPGTFSRVFPVGIHYKTGSGKHLGTCPGRFSGPPPGNPTAQDLPTYKGQRSFQAQFSLRLWSPNS